MMNTGTAEFDPFERRLPDGRTDFESLERACRRACEQVVDDVLAQVGAMAGEVGHGDVERPERALVELEGRGGGAIDNGCSHSRGP